MEQNNKITREEIEAIKRSVDIVELIRSRGVELKRVGKNYVGLCPFHEETTPSFTVDPEKQLYNCFGCSSNGKSSGGDAIGFVVRFDKVSFPEALTRLGVGAGLAPAQEEPTEKKPTELNPAQRKLLNRVMQYYQAELANDTRGLKYLQDVRNIKDKNSILDFGAGYVSGKLLSVIPSEGKMIDDLKNIGILNDKGNEFFYGCVVFPLLDDLNNVVSIYGRRIEDGEINHLYLPGPRRGLINRQAAKRSTVNILTESVIDALSLYDAGFKNVIPCYGVNGFIDDHLTLFTRQGVKVIYLCLDSDDAGKRATERISIQLNEKLIIPHPIKLPTKDVNDYFKTHSAKEFKQLLSGEQAQGPEDSRSQTTEHGFIIAYDKRQYEVIGISRTDTKLKATIKAKNVGAGYQPALFYIDTVDFYSSRSRKLLLAGLLDLFGENEEIINADINQLLEKVEAESKVTKPEEAAPVQEEISEDAKQEALRFLKNPEMFNEIIADFETAGYTGDNINKLLCYIAAISRKLENPLSVMIQSRSAAGKSFLQDTVLSFIPEKDFVKYTRLTDQSLFYKEKESLKHKILAIEEFDGMNGASYSVRAIQSSKKITVAYTGKDALTGQMKTAENIVEGPVMIFITTTKVDIDGETASRFIFISLDESREKTEFILEKQREKHTMEGLINKLNLEKIIKKHHAVNRLLKPLYVINPYSKLLTFTTRSLKVHREHDKYLCLISAIAYLFQYQREIKRTVHNQKEIEYITVKISDIEKAHQIANEVLGISLDELSVPSRRLLILIKEMVSEKCKEKKISPKEYHFIRREIREYSGWSDFQIRTHIKELEEMEYIYSVVGRHGKEYVYELVYTGGGEDGNKFLIGLISIEELKEKAKQAGLEVD